MTGLAPTNFAAIATTASPLTPSPHPTDIADDYKALGNHIRLLDRILGDVVREQASDETFKLIESVRRVAITARRTGTSSVADLEAMLGPQPKGRIHNVIHAFDWLSLPANTAEDLHVDRSRTPDHKQVVRTEHRVARSAPRQPTARTQPSQSLPVSQSPLLCKATCCAGNATATLMQRGLISFSAGSS
ncbi:MAG: phosphoenolpyruvate carboxylase [Ilumatobacter sp.]|nr:phosphoenolpyruvate carboxylase [Ilumatobacter sp.]